MQSSRARSPTAAFFSQAFRTAEKRLSESFASGCGGDHEVMHVQSVRVPFTPDCRVTPRDPDRPLQALTVADDVPNVLADRPLKPSQGAAVRFPLVNAKAGHPALSVLSQLQQERRIGPPSSLHGSHTRAFLGWTRTQ